MEDIRREIDKLTSREMDGERLPTSLVKASKYLGIRTLVVKSI
jgi:hypothetical protein